MGLPDSWTTPNLAVYDGPKRIKRAQFADGTIFRRRGGKAVDLHCYYQAATATSSNLAGFAEVEDVGVSGGHPESVSDGDELPVDFGLNRAAVFPTSGDVEATANHVGKDYDIYVDANGVQYIDLNSQTYQVLRVSKIVEGNNLHVSVTIPPDLRYGNL